MWVGPRRNTRDSGLDFPPAADRLEGGPGAGAQEELQRGIRRKKQMLVWIAGVSLVAAVGASLWNVLQRSRAARHSQADCALINEKLTAARDHITREDYQAAKASLDAAERLLGRYPLLTDLRNEHTRLAALPEIRFGSAGQVRVEGRWLTPAVAQAWRESRQRDDPLIEELENKARAAVAEGRCAEGQACCDQAIAVIESHPVRAHPRLESLRGLRAVAAQKLVVLEMTAKGYVEHNGRWMAPEEKHELEQRAKGLVKRGGKWMTKEEMFAADQAAKGLVLHEGRWVMSEERMRVLGYVRFEGRWVRAGEREEAIRRRTEEGQASIFDDEEARRRLKDRTTQLEEETRAKEVAYRASHEFVRKLLEPSWTAMFPPFGGPEVSVAAEQGWYNVLAAVDIAASGSSSRLLYYCKLRATSGGDWEAQVTSFVRN